MRSVISEITRLLRKNSVYTLRSFASAAQTAGTRIPEEERTFPLRAIMTRGGAARRKVSSRKIYGGKVDARGSFSLFLSLSLNFHIFAFYDRLAVFIVYNGHTYSTIEKRASARLGFSRVIILVGPPAESSGKPLSSSSSSSSSSAAADAWSHESDSVSHCSLWTSTLYWFTAMSTRMRCHIASFRPRVCDARGRIWPAWQVWRLHLPHITTSCSVN